jgi:hypothetical protein
MRFEWGAHELRVWREANDPKYYGNRNAAGESRLLYAIKVALNGQGHDLIKKRMWRDGHLVDDLQQYLRTRNQRSPHPHIYLYNPRWQIEGLNDEWNRLGYCDLAIARDIFVGQVRATWIN